jgi:hypothetical protein
LVEVNNGGSFQKIDRNLFDDHVDNTLRCRGNATMQLSEVLKQWRWAKKISVREAAKLIGIGFSTLSRVENGEDPGGESLAAILKWLLTKS